MDRTYEDCTVMAVQRFKLAGCFSSSSMAVFEVLKGRAKMGF